MTIPRLSSLVRDLARYETFKKKVLQEKFTWNIDKMTRKDIEDFEDYLRNEKTLSEKYPKQFESILEEYPAEINVVHTMVKLQDRGENTIVKLKRNSRRLCNGCMKRREQPIVLSMELR